MQIHELNNFSGTLGAGSYLAIDDGTDTGRISYQGFLASTEARIDTVIADGDAMRDQIDGVKSDLKVLSYLDDDFVDLSTVTITSGSYIKTNGTIATNGAFMMTDDYIPIPDGLVSVTLNRIVTIGNTEYPQSHMVWFYDSTKTLLGNGVETTTTNLLTSKPSAGAKYMRVNFASAKVMPFIKLNFNNSLRSFNKDLQNTDITDLDDLPYNFIFLRSASSPSIAHLPYSGWLGMVLTLSRSGQFVAGCVQIAISKDSRMHFRRSWGSSNTWGEWQELVNKSELTTLLGYMYHYEGAFTSQQEVITTSFASAANTKYIIRFRNKRENTINTYFSNDSDNYRGVYPWEDEVILTSTSGLGYLRFYNPSGDTLDNIVVDVFIADTTEDKAQNVPAKYVVNKLNAHRGDYTSFTQCLLDLKDDDSPKIIEVWEGDYDIYQEYVDANVPIYTGDDPSTEYFDYCVWIPKNTHIIGKGLVRLKWMPNQTDNPELTLNQSKCVSPINVAGSMTLENVEIHCKNGRYCIHNDALGKPEFTGARQIFKNVRCYKYTNDVDSGSGVAFGYKPCTGFGIDRSMHHIYENCVFINYNTESLGRAFYGHSRSSIITSENLNSDITLTNCALYTSGEDCVKFGNAGNNSNLHIRVLFAGCSFTGKVHCGNEGEATPIKRNAFDMSFINCGNVNVQIDDTTNPYVPQAYGSVLT